MSDKIFFRENITLENINKTNHAGKHPPCDTANVEWQISQSENEKLGQCKTEMVLDDTGHSFEHMCIVENSVMQ